jgi:hypothetical protein
MPSNQKFGFFFFVIFFACCLYFFFNKQVTVSIAFAGLSGAFALIAGLRPNLLEPLNKAWYLLGIFLGKIVSPLILGIMFFLMITPLAIGMKLAKRDVLFLKKRRTNSYWIDRNPQGPDSESFKNQF